MKVFEFGLDEKGDLMIRRQLDVEAATEFSFRVMVEDARENDTAMINISVIDWQFVCSIRKVLLSVCIKSQIIRLRSAIWNSGNARPETLTRLLVASSPGPQLAYCVYRTLSCASPVSDPFHAPPPTRTTITAGVRKVLREAQRRFPTRVPLLSPGGEGPVGRGK